MKCNKCKSEWSTSSAISASISVCPFCGESLFSKKETFATDYDVLSYIYTRFGPQFMRDGNRVLACFSDLAPMMKKEKRILSYFCECQGHIQILDSITSGASEQQLIVNRIIRQMTDDLFVAEVASRAITDSFFRAVSNQAEPVAQPKPQPVAPHTPLEDFRITGKTLVKYLGNDPVVIVPEGIRIIGKSAFEDNETVVEVRLPKSLQKIKEDAFSFCTKLQTINFPEGLSELEDFAFSYAGLKQVTIPDTLTVFGTHVFTGAALEKAIVPGSVAMVPASTFEACKSLREVVLCNGVSELGKGALDDCPNLNTITIPDTLETILPNNHRPHIFFGTDNIQVVNASEQWKTTHPLLLLEMVPAKTEDFNFYIKDNVLLRYYGRAERPAIPNTVTVIGPHAFFGNNHILGIKIPESVEKIEEGAFACCQNLQSLQLPRHLFRIGVCAFGYTGITALNIPNGVYGIDSRAFTYCKQLSRISFPDTLTSLAEDAFDGCDKITAVQASNWWKARHEDIIRNLLGK